jgi:hypothetical protein
MLKLKAIVLSVFMFMAILAVGNEPAFSKTVQREWQEGIVLDEHIDSTLSGIDSYGNALYHNYQIIKIDTGDYILEVSDRLYGLFHKASQLIVNDKIRYSHSGKWFYFLDISGREVRAKVIKIIAKPKPIPNSVESVPLI